jgi:hypothetical protein
MTIKKTQLFCAAVCAVLAMTTSSFAQFEISIPNVTAPEGTTSFCMPVNVTYTGVGAAPLHAGASVSLVSSPAVTLDVSNSIYAPTVFNTTGPMVWGTFGAATSADGEAFSLCFDTTGAVPGDAFAFEIEASMTQSTVFDENGGEFATTLSNGVLTIVPEPTGVSLLLVSFLGLFALKRS